MWVFFKQVAEDSDIGIFQIFRIEVDGMSLKEKAF